MPRETITELGPPHGDPVGIGSRNAISPRFGLEANAVLPTETPAGIVIWPLQLEEEMTMSLWMVNVPPSLHATSPSGAALAAIGAAAKREVRSRRQVAIAVFLLRGAARDFALLDPEQSVACRADGFSERSTFATAEALQAVPSLALADSRGPILRTFLNQESTIPRLIKAGYGRSENSFFWVV